VRFAYTTSPETSLDLDQLLLPAALRRFREPRPGEIIRTAGPAIMKTSGRNAFEIVLGLLVGLVVCLALYFFFFTGFTPNGRPPL
jgi:hypothetical protein